MQPTIGNKKNKRYVFTSTKWYYIYTQFLVYSFVILNIILQTSCWGIPSHNNIIINKTNFLFISYGVFTLPDTDTVTDTDTDKMGLQPIASVSVSVSVSVNSSTYYN